MTKHAERQRLAADSTSFNDVYVPLVTKHMRDIVRRARTMVVTESGGRACILCVITA